MAKASTRRKPAKPMARPKAKPKTASRTASKAKAKTNPVGGLDDPDDTMRIRKISNGYIVHESWTEGTGPNRKYRERETFTKVKPQVIVKQ